MAACARLLRTFCHRVLPGSRSSCLTVSSLSALKQKHICQNQMNFSSTIPRPKKESVNVTFVMRNGEKMTTNAKVGDSFLDVVIENDVDIDGFGACEGTLACSTCHLIFTSEQFQQLPESPTDEELDMLDLAYDLQDTSRLGCQVVITKNMEGWKVRVPAGVSDAREPS